MRNIFHIICIERGRRLEYRWKGKLISRSVNETINLLCPSKLWRKPDWQGKSRGVSHRSRRRCYQAERARTGLRSWYSFSDIGLIAGTIEYQLLPLRDVSPLGKQKSRRNKSLNPRLDRTNRLIPRREISKCQTIHTYVKKYIKD